jgi:micrococcal nuclease
MIRCLPAILTTCIVAALVLAAGCTLQADKSTSGTHAQFAPGTAYPASVVRVIDGDTVRVSFPDGSQGTIRILGVDTPELDPGESSPGLFEGISDPTYLASWAEKASSVLQQEVGDREVFITTDKQAGERDRYGRILAYLSTSDGNDIGSLLLKQGFARVYTPETFAREEDYLRLQKKAMQERIGIWSGMTPAQVNAEGVFLAEVHYDAAGEDDNFNLNDEYIVIRNGGSATVNLSGWEIHHRTVLFVFRDYSLGPGSEVTVRTGTGTPGQQELFVGSHIALLNNHAGTVTLWDNGIERSRFTW